MSAGQLIPPMRYQREDRDDDPRGREQKPETDCWPWRGVRRGPDHLAHAGHRDRETER